MKRRVIAPKKVWVSVDTESTAAIMICGSGQIISCNAKTVQVMRSLSACQGYLGDSVGHFSLQDVSGTTGDTDLFFAVVGKLLEIGVLQEVVS